MSVEEPTGERGLWAYDRETGTFYPVEKPKPIRVHSVIQDTMDPFVSDIDGKTVFESKSKWKREVKEKGYQIIGNERFGKYKEPTDKEEYESIREDAQKAANLIRWGMARPRDEMERESWEKNRKKG